MKNRIEDGRKTERIVGEGPEPVDEIVARFGEATLVRIAGRVVLRGGSMAERMEALEWMALFMPDTVTSLKG